MNQIYSIYKTLLNTYGAQGWWPFLGVGYHPNDYDYPKNEDQIFEVALGSILTQNTTFVSVQKALNNLQKINCTTSDTIKELDIEELKEAIKPAGYFNQKADYILNFIEFYDSLDGKVPSREELLKVKGVGEETADSILLYGYNQPQFKIDAYTKRLFVELGLVNHKAKYKEMKALMEESLKEITEDKDKLRIIYQEYHALIVEHGKRYYSKKPYGVGCFISTKQNVK
ncbi:MAG: endonuclease III domain-containing protein [Campylobacterota bacterium]|nr:endonuclease III domain-containing protein [Campylobacterota bacterium]